MFEIHKYNEEFQDTKEVISGSKSKNNRQHNCQKKQDTRTNNDLQKLTHKAKDCVTRTPLKTRGKLRFSRRVSRSLVAAVVYIYIYIAYKLNNNRHFLCVEYYIVWHDISGGNWSPVSMFLILLHVSLLLKSVISMLFVLFIIQFLVSPHYKF
jgi:hypothetical protein